MAENPNPDLRPSQDIPRLCPIPASNSSARAGDQTTLGRKQDCCPAQVPKIVTNSWAQSGEKGDLVKKEEPKPPCALQSILGRTYNDKPLPPLPEYPPPLCPSKSMARGKCTEQPKPAFPKATPSPSFVTRLKRNAYLKSTSALGSFGHTRSKVKIRADTDPIQPSILIPNRDDAFQQHHENDIESSRTVKEPEIKLFKVRRLYTPCVGNRAQSAGTSDVGSPKDEKTVSNLSSETRPDSTSGSNLNHSSSSKNLVRQLTNNVDPTSRYLLENRQPTLKIPERHRNRRGILKEAGRRKQRRASNLREARRVHFEPPIVAPRLSSHFELPEDEYAVNDNRGSEEAIAYSESEYSEEENNGTTGDSPLHPLSSLSLELACNPQNSESNLSNLSQGLLAAMPMIEDSDNDASPPYIASPGIWWTGGTRGNSFASPSLSPSNLIVAPLFAGQERSNAVPPPPVRSHPNYQQTTRMPADLAQLELNLHHHIDSGVSCLTRLLTDKTDRILDQLVRRLEALEEKVEKGTKDLESKVRDVRKECAILSQDNKALLKEFEKMKNSMKGLDLKADFMRGKIEESQCLDRCCQGKPPSGEPQNPDLQQAAPKRSPETKTAFESSGQNQQRKAPASDTTSHRTQGSTQGHRSSQTSSGRAERSSNEEILAQINRADRQPPDLRDHPAYTGGQSEHPLIFSETPSDDSGTAVTSTPPLFHTPSFRDGGWYKQAYGS